MFARGVRYFEPSPLESASRARLSKKHRWLPFLVSILATSARFAVDSLFSGFCSFSASSPAARFDLRKSHVLLGDAVGLRRARPPHASNSPPGPRVPCLFAPFWAALTAHAGPLHARADDLAAGCGAPAAPTTTPRTGPPLAGAPDDVGARLAAEITDLASAALGCSP